MTADAISSGPKTQSPAFAGVSARERAVGIWLLVMAGLVALMVIVGGATRLTDSGLSITEWDVVTGVIPPLTDEAWEAELDKYRQIPEYQLQNRGMPVDEFKEIYYWEWGHRLLGRLIGVAFLVPFIFFLARGFVTRERIPRLAGLFVLGGMQGVLGWFMVMSGLVDRVDVSQYRLAAHLSLAFIIFAALLWTALDYLRGTWCRLSFEAHPMVPLAFALTTLVFVQIVIGGFVAGLDAGFAYNTWPLMDGGFWPANLFLHSPWIVNFFENNATVQFAHRIVAYIVLAFGIYVWVRARGAGAPVSKAGNMMLSVIALQVVLGIWTLVAVVPISLGLAHQAGALIVFGSCIYLLHTANKPSVV